MKSTRLRHISAATIGCLAVALVAAAPVEVSSATAVPASGTPAVLESTYPTSTQPVSLLPGADDTMWVNDVDQIESVDQAGHLTDYTTTGFVDGSMVVDAHGDLWFPEEENSILASQSYIGEVTVGGVLHEYPVQNGPGNLALGSDGSLWFSYATATGPQTWTASGIENISTSGVVLADYPTQEPPSALVVSNDGGLWFTEIDRVGWITTGGVLGESSTLILQANLGSLAIGAGGDVWFGEFGGVGQISADHVVSEHPFDAANQDKASGGFVEGPDGNEWFDESRAFGSQGAFGRITPAGVITTFSLGVTNQYTDAGAILVGPGGNLWMTAVVGNGDDPAETTVVEQISTTGTVTKIPTGTARQQLLGAGPNGTMWFESPAKNSDQIGEIQPNGTSTIVATVATGTNAGTLALSFDSLGNAWVANRSKSTLEKLTPVTTSRISGADRYAGSVAIAQAAYPTTAPVVFVATGADYPDALSAAPAAAQLRGPLLLTAPTSLPVEVKTEIESLTPQTIVVVGGTGVISDAVEAQLRTAVPTATVTREAGADRYGTSLSLTSAAFDHGASTVFLANGANFPDALSATSAAASQTAPVILVNGAAPALDAATLAELTWLGASHVTITGGTGSVSQGIENQLDALYPGAVLRLGGADRYQTSTLINQHYFGSAPTTFVATGVNFPDALAGGVLAAKLGAPLVVTETTCVPSEELAAMQAWGTRHVTLLGGLAPLTAGVAALTSCS